MIKSLSLGKDGGKDEINDFDIQPEDLANNLYQIASCDDSGQAYIHKLNLNTLTLDLS